VGAAVGKGVGKPALLHVHCMCATFCTLAITTIVLQECCLITLSAQPLFASSTALMHSVPISKAQKLLHVEMLPCAHKLPWTITRQASAEAEQRTLPSSGWYLKLFPGQAVVPQPAEILFSYTQLPSCEI
jgi:hypothetical protein